MIHFFFFFFVQQFHKCASLPLQIYNNPLIKREKLNIFLIKMMKLFHIWNNIGRQWQQCLAALPSLGKFLFCFIEKSKCWLFFFCSFYCWNSRHSTVQKTLLKETTSFSAEEKEDQQFFGLISIDLTQIRPNYEAMVKGGALRITDDGYAQGMFDYYCYAHQYFYMC